MGRKIKIANVYFDDFDVDDYVKEISESGAIHTDLCSIGYSGRKHLEEKYGKDVWNDIDNEEVGMIFDRESKYLEELLMEFMEQLIYDNVLCIKDNTWRKD